MGLAIVSQGARGGGRGATGPASACRALPPPGASAVRPPRFDLLRYAEPALRCHDREQGDWLSIIAGYPLDTLGRDSPGSPSARKNKTPPGETGLGG